jgi:hypothetical protein
LTERYCALHDRRRSSQHSASLRAQPSRDSCRHKTERGRSAGYNAALIVHRCGSVRRWPEKRATHSPSIPDLLAPGSSVRRGSRCRPVRRTHRFSSPAHARSPDRYSRCLCGTDRTSSEYQSGSVSTEDLAMGGSRGSRDSLSKLQPLHRHLRSCGREHFASKARRDGQTEFCDAR